jgi:hypothetical protein
MLEALPHVFPFIAAVGVLALIYFLGKQHSTTSTTAQPAPAVKSPVAAAVAAVVPKVEEEVAKATTALQTAGVKGKELLDTIASVRKGEVTGDEVVKAHKKD